MIHVDDLGRSIAAFDHDSTLVVVIEMSNSSWLVAGMIPGVDRQPEKKLYQLPENLTPWGFPSGRKFDSMQHVVDSRSGQHVSEITRQDLSISQLRAEPAWTADAKQARRILAIAMMLGGHSRLLAAQASATDRQTLRDWVHRYNADGLAGLADRPRHGRQPRLAEAQRSEVAKWVEDGPDLKTDGVVRWRCADLRDRIAAKCNVHLHERSVGKLLKKLNGLGLAAAATAPRVTGRSVAVGGNY